jgi:uncharacterized membrane protein YhdT
VKCPVCNLENPPDGECCECGYDFLRGVVRREAEKPSPPGLRAEADTIGYAAGAIAALGLAVLWFLIGFLLGLGSCGFTEMPRWWVACFIAVPFLSIALGWLARRYHTEGLHKRLAGYHLIAPDSSSVAALLPSRR